MGKEGLIQVKGSGLGLSGSFGTISSYVLLVAGTRKMLNTVTLLASASLERSCVCFGNF